ncbi:putative iron ABC transporter periplasmic iron-binding protein [Hyphomonas johnsonii MHS-2]|uniref:Putative iron ABC transporter periplasmic iron-binding protein n=2 Tax=Hyphomonas johnsonii TaxID=81031 RepID=A0A059FSM4_9PROT|nr:putative iron ABC transporter periplasmic iron-binding protein [Hyphomonas johnsonii MHS-2]
MILLVGLCLAACSARDAPQVNGTDRPSRIVSLDYCADQFVLKLADRDRILAVSPDAAKDFSYMHAAAKGAPTVRPLAEDVLILKPDLVVRSYGGGPNAAAFFEQAGVPVLNVGWAGDIPSVMTNIQSMADGLGEPERGEALVTDMRARLDALNVRSDQKRALYLTPAGVTSGPGSLIHAMLVAAGLTNFEETSGWRAIPLERLAYDQPDVVVAAFFGSLANHPDAWSPMNHPVAQAQLSDRDVVPLQGAWTTCGGWFLMDAIEALAEGTPE